MAISSFDDYVGSAKQNLILSRSVTRTTIAATQFTVFDLAGNPGAGTLAGGNTANGVVPTSATAGYPTLNSFGAGAGYLSLFAFNSNAAGTISLYDRVFFAGAYSFNANTNLTSQPSFSGRLPGGDYKGLEIWVEQVTAATGNQAVNVTYEDENGASSSTGATGIGGAPTVGRMWQLPLAAGDSGVSKITNVTGSTASAGTFNVMVLRPLIKNARVHAVNVGETWDFLRTGLIQVYDTSALFMIVQPDSTSSGRVETMIQVAVK